ncbi:hypothetical protein ACSXC5_17380 (plasmid) [Clostridium perfringens]|uniref:hypothetical protein n=1 Tax=Clostridium perfringens TaxID=1502 RepID=UPI000B2D5F3B|nr:hypothetical protein [Clostridium perfringens]MDG6614136.1 hypothetical protein [Staphylococcus aureus]MBO3424696.1 hypothetical protein [Clostridium perfringens]MDM0868812.1 hypothetical protein [Clostridium perfringens]MDU6691751.1 hypothetical protein [Clostridium perfringens]MDZ5069215.1 hypothetical protein [Clostridium perfringens]
MNKYKDIQKNKVPELELGAFGQKMNALKSYEKAYLSGVVDGFTLIKLQEKSKK